MALTVSVLGRESEGSQLKIRALVTFDSSYPTGGESLTALALGLNQIDDVVFEDSEGYAFDADIASTKESALLKVYNPSAAITPAGTIVSTVTPHADSAGTPEGTNAVSATAGKLELASPAFSGTGYATAGQDVTTTDNQTMLANECAGMWFIADGLASSPAVLILSNTEVTGAPAVLTCNGVPPVTDGGTYKIVKNVGEAVAQVFTGAALATHSHASTVASAFTGTPVVAGGGSEVANATNLSTLAINVVVSGK